MKKRKEKPKVWVDTARVEIRRALAAVPPNFERIARSDIEVLIRTQVGFPPFDEPDGWSAVTISPYLSAVRQCVEQYMFELVQSHPPAEWLWFLRRVPDEAFAGSLPTTFGYKAGLADVASGLSTLEAEPIPLSSQAICFDINDSVVRRLVRFLTGVSFLFGIHVRLRFAGKGATFQKPLGNGVIPQYHVTSAMREAIELYDMRVARSQTSLGRAGTEISAKSADTNSMMVVHRTMPPRYIETPVGQDVVFVETRFVPKFVLLDALQRINSDLQLAAPGIWPPEVVALATLLRGGFEILASTRNAPANVLNVGYVTMQEELFHQSLANCWNDTLSWQQNVFPRSQPIRDTTELLRRLKTLRGSFWPLQFGPVIRDFEDGICLDLNAATNLLEALLEFPAQQGTVANIRSRHFELAVQDSINASQWKPSQDLLRMRGVGLRREGQDFTDIDALGVREDTLLLVSCKSVIYSKGYDAGDYRFIRNIASLARDSVERWSEVMRIIIEHPSGDNYNFTEFTRVIGVVCVPHVIYVPLGDCTELVSRDLPALVSLEELRAWLSSRSQNAPNS
jgi:hypothetical protein